MPFVTILVLHNWHSNMPHQAKGAVNRTVGQTLMSKTLPRFTGAEVRTEALETKRVVRPAFLREKVNKISFFPIQQLRCRCASEWAVDPSAGGRAAQRFTADCVNVWNHWEWVTAIPVVHMQAQAIYSRWLVYLTRGNKVNKEAHKIQRWVLPID